MHLRHTELRSRSAWLNHVWFARSLGCAALGIALAASLAATHPRVAAAQDDSSTKAPLSDQVDRLVRQMAQGSRALRDRAEKQLIELGPDVLVYLPPIDRQMPEELKVRLRRITSALEDRLAESVWKARRFSLSGKRPIAEWLKEIEKQTGNRLVAEDLPSGPVDVELPETDFWPGLDRLLDQWQLDVDIYGAHVGALTLGRRLPDRLSRAKRAAYAGPMRIEATRVQLSRDLRAARPATALVELELAWEPRVAPIAVEFPMSEFYAIDGAGARHESTAGGATPTFPVRPGMSAVTLAIPFPAPDRSVKRWTRMGGACRLLVPGELAEFEFTDLSKPSVQKKASVQVRYQKIVQNGDVWELRVDLEYDETFTGLDSHRGWVEDNPIYLIGPDGKKLEPLGLELTQQTRHAMGFAFLFDLEDEPTRYKLFYATPAKILEKEVKFELPEIDLP